MRRTLIRVEIFPVIVALGVGAVGLQWLNSRRLAQRELAGEYAALKMENNHEIVPTQMAADEPEEVEEDFEAAPTFKTFRLTWDGWEPEATLCKLAEWLEDSEPENTLEYFRAALKVNADHPTALVGICRILLAHQRYRELTDELAGPAAKLTIGHTMVNDSLAVAFHQQGRMPEALESLHRNYQVSKFSMSSILLEARYLWELGDFEALLNLVTKALQKSPDTVELKLFQARSLIQSGEVEAARSIVDSLSRKNKAKLKFAPLLAEIETLLSASTP